MKEQSGLAEPGLRGPEVSTESDIPTRTLSALVHK
jgi:hypothetical protein